MAVFKCKMCGGDLNIQEGHVVCECEYCGSIQTLPKDKDERIGHILNRANDFRLCCDFDRAIFEYEKVLELDETEPEAHWGIFLSKYGVEYVKDTMTLTYKPTLHRISSVSVFDDVDYQATIKYASPGATVQYKSDAEKIEQVMKELLLLSANQEPYDIFLSYKKLDDKQPTIDSFLAHELYNELTGLGYKVFFAPKSLVGSGEWEPKIYSAIISAKVMIVLGTRTQYFNGVWVKNEWSRFAELIENGEDKVLIPVFKNMSADEIPNRLTKYQVYDMNSLSFLDDVKKVISQAVMNKYHVSFDKNASAENASLERGFLKLEDGEFTQADSFFEKVLDINPHNSQAYFGKLMIEMGIKKQSQILSSSKYLKEYANFEKAVRYAEHQLKTTLLQYEEKVQYALDTQKYNQAVSIISKANPSENDYNEAARVFEFLSTFKDAKNRKEECVCKADICRKDRILQEGIESCGDFSCVNELEKAIACFKSIPGWKDADERLAKCEIKITEIRLRIEKENQKARAKEKRNKVEDNVFTYIHIVWTIIVVVIAIILLIDMFMSLGFLKGILIAIIIIVLAVFAYFVGVFVFTFIAKLIMKLIYH